MALKTLVAGLLSACLLALPTSAATLVSYTSLSGASLPADFVAPGVVALDVTRGPGILERDCSCFNSRNWTIDGSKQEAIDNGDFLFWGFSVSAPQMLTVLQLGYQRSPTGPASLALELSLNGGVFDPVWSVAGFAADTALRATITFTGSPAVTEASFRLIGWDATGTLGTLRLANAAEFGDGAIVLGATAIPLPPALPLLGAGLLLLAALRQRRP